MNVREETSGETGRHQWSKGPRLKGAATSWKREDIQQDHQEGSHVGDHEAMSRTFSQDSEKEYQDIVEGSAPSTMKEETTHRLRAGDVGAPATLGSLPAPTERRIFIVCILLCVTMWKIRLMAVHLDRLASYVETTWDERP
jgi:hypothetical protein